MTILIACVNIGRAEKAQTTISVNQTTTHHSYQSQSSPSIVLNGDEINAINTKDENHKPPAKSKPKRQIGLKIFGGVVVAYGLYSHTSKKFDNLTPLRSYVIMFTGIISQIDPLHRTEIDPLSRDKSMTNNKELNTGNIGYFEL
jgi:hypothetical protein